MPTVGFAVTTNGLIVDVLIGLCQTDLNGLIAAGLPIPNPVLCSGDIDTGSNISGVSSKLLRSLGLTKPLRSEYTQTASGRVFVDTYRISATILNMNAHSSDRLFVADLEVIELTNTQLAVDVLIGLDVLAQCQFHLDGPGQTFSLDF